jgi:hypothetical protein
LKIRLLADANFNQNIVAGLLLREPRIDLELPHNVIPDGMKDPKVPELGATLRRVGSRRMESNGTANSVALSVYTKWPTPFEVAR